MRPVIRALERRGARGATSPRATSRRRSACSSASGSTHEAIGRHRGGRLGGQGRSGWRRARSRSRAGRKGAALRRRARPRLQRRHGRGEAARHPERDDVRLRVGDGPAHRQLPARAARRRARTRSRPSGSRRYGATPAKLRRYPGLKEEYYLADFEPDPAVLDELGLDAARAARRRAHAAGGLALPPLRAPAVRAAARRACASRRRSSCSRARPSSAPSWPRRAATSCPSARSTRSRWSRYADLVVSAGGTMNREAVALGTPVWTTFEGRLGAVDERLIAEGRLRRLERAGGRRASSGARRRSPPATACAAIRRSSPTCW